MIVAWQAHARFPEGASPMNPLTAEEARTRLGNLPGWQIESGELVRTFQFKDFLAALHFVNRIAEAAEKAGHHPDIDIRYNRVRLALVTHDAGGLTVKDYDLAGQASELSR
jgi:4a-hydroxytetrahydrobiopterin dehydratase